MRHLLVLAIALAGCDGPPPAGGEDAAAPPACEYPSHDGTLALGRVIPPWRWENVRDEDGAVRALDLREVHCSPAYDGYRSIVLVVGAGWCPACPEYLRAVNAMSRALEDRGALVVYVEVETAAFEPASGEDAERYVNGLIGDGPGLRVGDGDNTEPSALRRLVTRMPSGYFIRRRDMVVGADQKDTIYQLDWGSLAADPEQPWTPMPPPFVARCGPEDEEAGEPNDELARAQPIRFDEEVAGGVCAPGGDFYRIDETGPWRFDLYTQFLADRQNLDLRLYDRSGERIGGSTQRSNHDWVDYEGPAYVEVYGHDGASATYRVTLGPQP
ncbi:MAG: hypothetical protein KF729_10700 [Sandaracinaceae bacterium]|nr:hypothetical protein [Sandaracinaceae bacterium]